ncbi:hypothetical protein [Thiohalobacter thiocyanaticus]|nr:hypothetical protein [Thiohalobacter thiocyanaticus]
MRHLSLPFVLLLALAAYAMHTGRSSSRVTYLSTPDSGKITSGVG